MHVYDYFRGRPLEHFQVVNRDLARFQFHVLAFARHFVGFASLYLYSRIRRGSLFDLTNKSL